MLRLEEHAHSSVEGSNLAEEGDDVIDLTHVTDGVPIDISSPHRNHGVFQEEMMFVAFCSLF